MNFWHAFIRYCGRPAAGIARHCARRVGFIRPVAAVTLMCFVYSSIGAPCVQGAIDLSASTQANNQLKAALSVPAPAFALDVPMFLGRVTGGTDHGSPTLVINIQDLHCHAEVQRNISGILQFLDNKYSLDTVFIEGGYGKLDTSWLNGVTDPAVKKQVADALLESGRLTGGEYYSMTTGRYGLLRGLEDEQLHKANIVRLGKMLEKKPLYEEHIGALNRDLDFMKKKYLTLQNRRFNKLLTKYKTGGMDTARYYALLGKYVAKVNEHPEKYHNILALSMRSFPAIQAYLETAALQKRLNYNKVSRQLREFVQVLKTHLPVSVYNDILQKTDDLAKTDELYAILAQMIQEYKLDTAKGFPDLTLFFAYLEKNKTINALDLLKENQRLTEELRVAFSGDIAELEVSFLADFFNCYEDYLLNRLSADDYVYFQSRFEQFKSTWGKYTLVNHVQDLAADHPLLDEYYALNDRRNTIFLNNIFPSAAAASLDKGSPPKVIVMVNGGFHTAGVTKLLDKRKISHITITPHVTTAPQEAGAIYESTTRYQAKLFGSQALGPSVMASLGINVTQSNGGVRVGFKNGAFIDVTNGECTFGGDEAQWEALAQIPLQQTDLKAVTAQIILLLGVLTAPVNPFKMEKTTIDGIMKLGEGLAELGFTGELVWEIAQDKDFQSNIEKFGTQLPLFQTFAAGHENFQERLSAFIKDNKDNPLVPLFEKIARMPEATNIPEQATNAVPAPPTDSVAPRGIAALAVKDMRPDQLAAAVVANATADPGALTTLTNDLAKALVDVRTARNPSASLVLESTYEIVRRVVNLFLPQSKKLPINWQENKETHKGLRTVAQYAAAFIEENYATVDPLGFLKRHTDGDDSTVRKRARGTAWMVGARVAGFVGMALLSQNILVLVPLAAVLAYSGVKTLFKKDISASERRIVGPVAVAVTIAIVVSMHLNPLLLLFGLGGVAAHLGYNIINKIRNWNAELTLDNQTNPKNIISNINALLEKIEAIQTVSSANQEKLRISDGLSATRYQDAILAAQKKYPAWIRQLNRFQGKIEYKENINESELERLSIQIADLEISLGTLWLDYQITLLRKPVDTILSKYEGSFPETLSQRYSAYFDAIYTTLNDWRKSVPEAVIESDAKSHYETLQKAANEAAIIRQIKVDDDLMEEIEAQFEKGVKKLREASTFGDLVAIMEMARVVRDDRQEEQQQRAKFLEQRSALHSINTIVTSITSAYDGTALMPGSVEEYIKQLRSIEQKIKDNNLNTGDETIIPNIISQAEAIQWLWRTYAGEQVEISDGKTKLPMAYDSAIKMVVENRAVVEDRTFFYSQNIRDAIDCLHDLYPERRPNSLITIPGFEQPIKFSQARNRIIEGTIELIVDDSGNTSLKRTLEDTARDVAKAARDALAGEKAPLTDKERTKMIEQIDEDLKILDAIEIELKPKNLPPNVFSGRQRGALLRNKQEQKIDDLRKELSWLRRELEGQKIDINRNKIPSEIPGKEKIMKDLVSFRKVMRGLWFEYLYDDLDKKFKKIDLALGTYQFSRTSLPKGNEVYFDKIRDALAGLKNKLNEDLVGAQNDVEQLLRAVSEEAIVKRTIKMVAIEVTDDLIDEIEKQFNGGQKLREARTIDDLLAILSMAQDVINNQQQAPQQTVPAPKGKPAVPTSPVTPAVSGTSSEDDVRADIQTIVKELEMDDSSTHTEYINQLRSIESALDEGKNPDDVAVANIRRQAEAIEILGSHNNDTAIEITGAGTNDYVDYGTALQRIISNTVVVDKGELCYAPVTIDAIAHLDTIDFTTGKTTTIKDYPGRLGYEGILKSIKNGTIILEGGQLVHVGNRPVGISLTSVATADTFSESEKKVLGEILKRAGFADGQIDTILKQGVKYVESFLSHLKDLINTPKTTEVTAPPAADTSEKTLPAGRRGQRWQPTKLSRAERRIAGERAARNRGVAVPEAAVTAATPEEAVSPAPVNEAPAPLAEKTAPAITTAPQSLEQQLKNIISEVRPSASPKEISDVSATLAQKLTSIFQRKTLTDAQKNNLLNKAVRLTLAGIPVSAAALRFVPETLIAKKALYERHGIPVSITTLRLNPAIVIARKLVLMENHEEVTIDNLRYFSKRFPALERDVADRVLTNLDQWQDEQWENLVQFAKDKNYVFELHGGYLIPFPRFWSMEGKNASEEIDRLFDMQSHAIIGPGMGIDEARSLKARFVMIEENNDMEEPGVVNFAVLKNGQWSTYTREVPPEALDGATIVILFNTGRARRPGGKNDQAKAGPATVNVVDPVEVEGRDSVKELRPSRIAKNPLEMGVTWTSRHGTWAAYNNKYPIFPRREGKNKKDQFNHFVLARADVDGNGKDVTVPQQWMSSLEAIEDILDFQEMVNSSLPEGSKPYTAGVNGWFYSHKKGAVRGGASQNHAHAQILRFPFPIAHAKTTPVGSVNGIDMSVLAEGALNTGIVLETDRGNRQALARMMYETIKKITSIDADNTGRSFDYLVIPTADGTRLRAFIFDRTASKPQFHGNEILDGEPAYAELGDALIVSNPDHFFKNKLPRTATTVTEVAEWVKTQSQEVLVHGIDALDTAYFSQAQEALRGATADAEEVRQIAAAVLAETARANTPEAPTKQQKPVRKTPKNAGNAAVVADAGAEVSVPVPVVPAKTTIEQTGLMKEFPETPITSVNTTTHDLLVNTNPLNDNTLRTELEKRAGIIIKRSIMIEIPADQFMSPESFQSAVDNRDDLSNVEADDYVFVNIIIDNGQNHGYQNRTILCQKQHVGSAWLMSREVLPDGILYINNFGIDPSGDASQVSLDYIAIHKSLQGMGFFTEVFFPRMLELLTKNFSESKIKCTAMNRTTLNAFKTHFGGIIRSGNPDQVVDWRHPVVLEGKVPSPDPKPAAKPVLISDHEDTAVSEQPVSVQEGESVASWTVAREALGWRRPGKVVVASSAVGAFLAAGGIAFFLTQALPWAIGIAVVAAGVAAALTGSRKQIRAEVNIALHYVNNETEIADWDRMKSTDKDLSVHVFLLQSEKKEALDKSNPLLLMPIQTARNTSELLYGDVTVAGNIILKFPQQSAVNPDEVMRQISQALVARNGLGANPRIVKGMKRLIKMAATQKALRIPSMNGAQYSLAMVDHVRPALQGEDAVSVTPEGNYLLRLKALPQDGDLPQAVDNVLGLNAVTMGHHFVLNARDIRIVSIEQLIEHTGTASLILTMDQIEEMEKAGKNIPAMMQAWRAKGKFVYVDARRFEQAIIKQYVKDRNLEGYYDANGPGPSLISAGKSPQKCQVITDIQDLNDLELSAGVAVIELKPVFERDQNDNPDRVGVMALQVLMAKLQENMRTVLKDDKEFQRMIDNAVNMPEGAKAILRAA